MSKKESDRIAKLEAQKLKCQEKLKRAKIRLEKAKQRELELREKYKKDLVESEKKKLLLQKKLQATLDAANELLSRPLPQVPKDKNLSNKNSKISKKFSILETYLKEHEVLMNKIERIFNYFNQFPQNFKINEINNLIENDIKDTCKNIELKDIEEKILNLRGFEYKGTCSEFLYDCNIILQELALLMTKELTSSKKNYDRIMECFGDLSHEYRPFQYYHRIYYDESIFSWWTNDLDKIIKKAAKELKWYWTYDILEKITSNVDPKVFEKWKNSERCSNRTWENHLLAFCENRGSDLHVENLYEKPKNKKCLICGKSFDEDSIPYPMVKRIGINNIDYCFRCMFITYQNTGRKDISKKEIIKYLKDLTKVIEKIPPQGFGERISDLQGYNKETLTKILKIMQNKPSVQCVKNELGSWLNALIQAKIIEDGALKTNFGTHVLAKDGHLCLSLGEKTIDDYLYSNKIKHSKEPTYPEGNYRADFCVNGTFIEYFGLLGNKEYDEKTRIKKALCKKHNVKLIEIYPKDLVNINSLEKKLKIFKEI